ncbi:TonB-dependent receptor; Outer membrane receptor for ferrienterochelin and colicins [hydrothermal vent metagenome]|uniref:TonB-dependent receptor Outer membrane receptor for ferrienterochelin and colicins n=1 Tax=hydrothermal vent metagenome TaxID=652676 RepID=A0A3B1CY60_9ZZZZ
MTKNIIISIFMLFISVGVNLAQNSFSAIIKDKETKEPLIGVNVVLEGTTNGTSSDLKGMITIQNIPDGKQTFVFSYIGYETVEKSYQFPLIKTEPIIIYLETLPVNLGEIIAYSTRTNNRVEEVPTRIEVIGPEEISEGNSISPGNITRLLGENSGIQIQKTSAVSGNVSLRIQGLPGQYTQLLQDGFPMYGGLSSGLSLLQIPPLDLRQVEIIKGSSSTLYGGDAIAGIVNLITKVPSEKPELSLLFNQTHKAGTDISSYYSSKHGKFGFTMLAAFNIQQAKDVSGNNFTDIPKYNRVVISPKLFYDFDDDNHLFIGLSSVFENRIGGSMKAINNKTGNPNSFFEENKTKRLNGYLKYEHTAESGNILTLKGNIGSFERNLTTNVNMFNGLQTTAFSELSYMLNLEKHKFVSGINFYYDNFNQEDLANEQSLLNYNHKTVGVFLQDNWALAQKFVLEPGVRFDYNREYGSFFLPRLAAKYHFTDNFFTRISSGLGYKIPTPFTGDAERTRYQNVKPLSGLKAEKSVGVNWDLNFKIPFSDELFLSINQSFFLTNVYNPIISNPDSLLNQTVLYQNANGSIQSKGLNTIISVTFDELVFYVDYTYLDARKTYDNNSPLELTPQNRLSTVLYYEDEEDGWKVGIESFYFGNQYLENGSKTPNYWIFDAMLQKEFEHLTIALNIENILDVRQTRYENIVNPPLNNPVFNEIYAPLEGIVANIVLKYDFY